MTKIIKIGGVKGRHEMPVDHFVFENAIENPADIAAIENHVENMLCDVEPMAHIDFFVTGLTVVTTAVIKFAINNANSITIHHFDNATGKFVPQVIIDEVAARGILFCMM